MDPDKATSLNEPRHHSRPKCNHCTYSGNTLHISVIMIVTKIGERQGKSFEQFYCAKVNGNLLLTGQVVTLLSHWAAGGAGAAGAAVLCPYISRLKPTLSSLSFRTQYV